MSNFLVYPLTGYFGAEIIGNITSLTNYTLLGLLNIYAVLVFRNQSLSSSQFSLFAKTLGNPTLAHPVQDGLTLYPEILEVDSSKIGKNAKWHTDVSYTLNPPSITILQAVKVPRVGGDTLFSDLQASYKYLSPIIKEIVNKLEAVHKITPLAYWGEPFNENNIDEKDKWELYRKSLKLNAIIHPVTRIHPVTGEPNLFVNPGYTSYILNMSKIESEHILRLLWEHSVKPEYTMRHQWVKGDVVLWDNTRTMHYAVDDYINKRIMNRICIKGSEPFGYNKKSRELNHENLLEVIV
jgi:taurine dioxygenase